EESRTALVATATTVSAPRPRASRASSRTAAAPRSMDAAPRRGSRAPIPSLMRTSSVRERTSARPPPRARSATRSLIELLPMSMTAALMLAWGLQPEVLGGDEEGELPLEARRGEGLADLARRPDPEGLVQLRDLLGDADHALRPQGGHDVVHGLGDPVAALVEGDRVPEVAVRAEEGKAGGRIRGEEAGEEEPVRRKAARAEGRGERDGPRDGHDRQRAPAAGAHDPEAGGAQARRPGVGRQGDGAGRGDGVREALGGLRLVVLVVGHELAAYPQAREEGPRGARVLAGDEVGGAEDRARPVGQIREVPARCRDDAEVARLGPERRVRMLRAQCTALPLPLIPGIWPSQSAGRFQGMDESAGASIAQPARTVPSATSRTAATRFRDGFILRGS